jgi:hypothetical protein
VAGSTVKTGCGGDRRRRPRDRGHQIGILGEEVGDLGLNRLGEQGLRTVAQDFGELVVESSWLNQSGDIIVRHGISLLWLPPVMQEAFHL